MDTQKTQAIKMLIFKKMKYESKKLLFDYIKGNVLVGHRNWLCGQQIVSHRLSQCLNCAVSYWKLWCSSSTISHQSNTTIKGAKSLYTLMLGNFY